jgi:glucose/arabinose dehydrogenase
MMRHRLEMLGVAAVSLLMIYAADPPSPFYDYTGESPGRTHKITVSDLPAPSSQHVGVASPEAQPRPEGAMPKTLPGFKVNIFASDLTNPRELRAAPNSDVFLTEMDKGDIKVFRGVTKDGRAEQAETFASGLHEPFGIAFYPPGANPEWVYVGDTDSVKRFPYHNGDLKARGEAQTIIDEIYPGAHGGHGGHSTRDLAFSADGKNLFISVGSVSNIDDPDSHPAEFHRANVLVCNPDGSGLRVFASGIRNPVGLAIEPKTAELWTAVNERDALGDNLVPDYTTHVQDGGFYGWPWYYIGKNHDPRLKDSHPDWREKMITPDVLIQAHSAPLGFAFYNGEQFPAEYHGEMFLALHGSWNRSHRTGYEVVRVPLHDGKASGEYQDFLTGFVTEDGKVWGRPVGIAVAKDGSLLVSDDGTGSIWRVSYVGK